jgi:hypothetical protein
MERIWSETTLRGQDIQHDTIEMARKSFRFGLLLSSRHDRTILRESISNIVFFLQGNTVISVVDVRVSMEPTIPEWMPPDK